MVPGAPAADAPVQSDGRPGWLLDHVGGRFDLLLFDAEDDVAQRLASGLGDAVRIVRVTSSGAVKGQLIDFEGHVEHRYDGRPGTAYLLRPDQHVAARWRSASGDDVRPHCGARRDTDMALNTQPNIAQPDDFYQALIEAHAGLTEAQSAALNARLILLLANQVGDLGTLKEALAAARAAA